MPSEPASQASITIRKLDPLLKEKLRVRAAEHGHSMEAEVRPILQAVLTEAEAMFAEDFAGRVLPFDTAAAAAYAEIFATRRKLGRPTALLDLMIAAIARARDATVVTRDVAGFAACGVALVNPWQA